MKFACAVSILMLTVACSKPEPAPTYQAVPVQTRDIVVTAQAAGSILPDTVVEVKSKASGEILEFNVQTGQLVQRGQLLARIDRRAPQNQLSQATAQLEVAEAQLRNAESQLRRSQELYDASALSQQELETAQLAVANSRASVVSGQVQVENAKIALDDTEVRAPMTGTIIVKNVERGAVISSPVSDVGGGTALARMADLSLVQVKTYVDQTDIGKIQPGLETSVRVEAYPNRPFRGEVIKVEPQADTISSVVMFAVLVRIDNREGLLKPGMSAEVQISVGEATGVLAVPNAALRTERDAASAAGVLGIGAEEFAQQLARAKEAFSPPRPATDTATQATLGTGGGAPPVGGRPADGRPATNGATGRPTGGMRPPAGFTGGRGGQGGQRGGAGRASTDALFGGTYIVFAVRDGKPTPVYVRTGITDLDWSEVRSGLQEGDSVMLLPSASLIQAQQGLQERMNRNSGLPGQGTGGGR
ncbi:MAG: efflux RND transporter periplasmic adaptor subunit [Gemmatimonadales bacterium]|nr:efflux RND transporter periplasmic adaptor subunit [Gemmatimonadales bacterium]MDZ4389626.1 efflux RND transporter periplasmic adaptor subunit [Gemmatimonadales bacterium]